MGENISTGGPASSSAFSSFAFWPAGSCWWLPGSFMTAICCIGIILLATKTNLVVGLRRGGEGGRRFFGFGTNPSLRVPIRPKIFHRTLSETEIKPRVIIIGDVHGCLDELQELLKKCDYNPDDSTVILVRL
jgi:hypothetical protein